VWGCAPTRAEGGGGHRRPWTDSQRRRRSSVVRGAVVGRSSAKCRALLDFVSSPMDDYRRHVKFARARAVDTNMRRPAARPAGRCYFCPNLADVFSHKYDAVCSTPPPLRKKASTLKMAIAWFPASRFRSSVSVSVNRLRNRVHTAVP